MRPRPHSSGPIPIGARQAFVARREEIGVAAPRHLQQTLLGLLVHLYSPSTQDVLHCDPALG
jgi:hypothetical protein